MLNSSPSRRFRRLATATLLSISVLPLSLLPASAGAEGLYDVYQQAREYDAQLRAAMHDYQAASQNVPITRSALRPQIGAGLSSGFYDYSNDGSDNFVAHQLTLSLNQTVFNRVRSLDLSRAELGLEIAKLNLEAEQQGLIMRVATAYFNVLRASAELEYRRAELDAIARQKEQNERRFDVGLVPITDLKNAQAQYDLAYAREIASANQLAAAKESLIAISGSNPETLRGLRENAPLVAPDPADMKAWIKISEDQNLQLLAARLQLELSRRDVDSARANRYPTLDLVGVGTMNQTEQFGRSDSESGQVRLDLNVPILTGGRNTALISQARSEMQATNQRLVAQRRATVQTTRDAYRNVVADISRVNALRQALLSTQKSLQAQEAGYKEGLLTSLEVLRSLQDTFSAQSSWSAARYDYILNLLALKQASGMLNENDLKQIDSWLQGR